MLVVSSLASGGAERVMSLLADSWAARGHAVTLVTLAPRSEDFFTLGDGVQRISLDIGERPRNKREALVWIARVVRRLRRALRAGRPDAVVSFIDAVNVMTLLATWGLRVPVIVSERIDPTRYATAALWARLRRLLYRRAAALVVQTESVRGWAETLLPRHRVAVIPNPVVPTRVAPEAGRAGGHRVIGMGRLAEQKGFDLLLRAFARCAAAYPDWTLQILGEGDERARLQALAHELRIADRVQFCGRVAQPEVLLRQADLFVLSSRYEGFPNALLEAMACGLAVIATDCPSGPRDIVRDGVDGLLVRPDDVDALAGAMTRLLGDAGERRRLATLAPEVAERFGIEKVLGLWERLLHEVTEGRCG